MSQQRVAVRCPSCSPSTETPHEVLNRGGGVTVRCIECSHVHKTTIDEEATVDRRVVVSQGEESIETRVDIPPEERLVVGDEFLVETEEAILTARITSLEKNDGSRADGADADDVKTIWARAVGNVEVNLTLHPKEGSGEETRSVRIQVPGDESFVVGATHEYGGEQFTVERIMVTDDATEYERDDYDRDNDSVLAKDIKRLYARDEDSKARAWSGW